MLRILLVEDEFLVRQVAFDELGDAGHCVVEAANGDAAAAILQDDSAFDLICTDIRMPGMLDGWQLGAAARSLIPGIKVLYFSGYCETQRTLEPGEAFLPKPYRLADMLALVESLTSVPSDAR
ncbi:MULTISPECIES: response regulator [unclassified Novosphingobium]|uniref:response regulator n=1 Tax=unclassified Novosphingobium TaxID=2644732 RepID=UPI0025E2D038|nr:MULTISPECIES: response regulator [unclassified Novosphingobium]HQS68085.1 response regulator [Novosphingobium sp.]